jgi:hypothetical protein
MLEVEPVSFDDDLIKIIDLHRDSTDRKIELKKDLDQFF